MFEDIKELKHHSPSSISQFIEYRSAWYISRILGIKAKSGIAAVRGTAVEEGLNFYLSEQDASMEDCIKHALKNFDESYKTITSNDVEIRQSVGPCVRAAIESFDQKEYTYFGPELQKELSDFPKLILPGCKRPIYGKLDYFFDGKKVVDNKVVAKTPTYDKFEKQYKIKQAYIIQGAIYHAVTGLPVTFHFVIPLKESVNIVEHTLTKKEIKYGLDLASKAAQAIETIYDSIYTMDGNVLKAFFFPNPTSVFNEEEREDQKKIFGVE